MEVWFKVTDRDHGLYPHAHSAQSSKTSKLREWPWDSDHCLNSGFPNNYLQLTTLSFGFLIHHLGKTMQLRAHINTRSYWRHRMDTLSWEVAILHFLLLTTHSVAVRPKMLHSPPPAPSMPGAVWMLPVMVIRQVVECGAITMGACVLSHFSHVWLLATPWTVAHQVPLSLGFCKRE